MERFAKIVNGYKPLTIFAKRSILDVLQGLSTPLDDISRLDRLIKSVLLLKPSVFIVLPIIQNQSKTKTIPHTVFETFINNNFRYKTQKAPWWVL